MAEERLDGHGAGEAGFTLTITEGSILSFTAAHPAWVFRQDTLPISKGF